MTCRSLCQKSGTSVCTSDFVFACSSCMRMSECMNVLYVHLLLQQDVLPRLGVACHCLEYVEFSAYWLLGVLFTPSQTLFRKTTLLAHGVGQHLLGFWRCDGCQHGLVQWQYCLGSFVGTFLCWDYALNSGQPKNVTCNLKHLSGKVETCPSFMTWVHVYMSLLLKTFKETLTPANTLHFTDSSGIVKVLRGSAAQQRNTRPCNPQAA